MPFFFYLVLRLLPGTGGGSPARRGAWGERGDCPSTPPAPPYSPLGGNAESVFFIGLYPVRRVSRGRRREPSPACGRGDVRACCGAPSALRASGIAFAPAPSLHQRRGRRGKLCRAAVLSENDGQGWAGRRLQRETGGGAVPEGSYSGEICGGTGPGRGRGGKA